MCLVYERRPVENKALSCAVCGIAYDTSKAVISFSVAGA